MKLKNINITPTETALSTSARNLFAKFKDMNDADESHYYQPNAKVTEVCGFIDTLNALSNNIKGAARDGNFVRPDMYNAVKERARDLLSACDGEDKEAHVDLPRKTDALEAIGKQIAEQLLDDLKGLYLCVKSYYNHTVTIIKVINVRSSLTLNGRVGSDDYSIKLRIVGHGVKRTDENDIWAMDDRAMSFGRFTVELDPSHFMYPSHTFSMGLVTPKQFHSYITKAVQDMTEQFGLVGNEAGADGIK